MGSGESPPQKLVADTEPQAVSGQRSVGEGPPPPAGDATDSVIGLLERIHVYIYTYMRSHTYIYIYVYANILYYCKVLPDIIIIE